MNINHTIGSIFTSELMDDNFSGDVQALNRNVMLTIMDSKWNDAMLHTDENPDWIAWEAFITWFKKQLKLMVVDMDDDTMRENVGIWFNAVFGDHHVALQTTVKYIIEQRNAQKEEETTMKNTNSIIDMNNITEVVTCAHCGCIIATPEDGEMENYEIIDGNVYCEDCIDELYVTCEECGERILKDDAVEVNGEYYCEDCADEKFVECTSCGELVDRDDAVCDAHGDYYCNSCAEDELYWCDHCEEYYPQDEITFIEGENRWVCDDCLANNYTRCEHCGEYVRNEDTITVYVNDRGWTEEWCYGCTEYNTWTCDGCGETFSDDVHQNEDGYDYYCDECYESRNGCQNTGDINTWRSPRGRQGYSFKPAPCLCATESERSMAGSDWKQSIVFYGFELEIDRREKCYKEDEWSTKIVEELPSTYCKQDCSLDKGGSYSGIEIVSHPATLAWYQERHDDFDGAFTMLKDGGWLSHDAGTCGLHIHISLHALEAANPYAVNNMLFIFDRFWDNLVKFSRRTEAQLNHWAKRYSTARGTYETIKNMAKGECDRYMAVNLQNSHTVEIRMFRGTLNTETFFATLQLMDVIVKRCIEIGSDVRRLQGITWAELVASDHKELNDYLERRGLKEGSVELPEPAEAMPEEPIQTAHDYSIGDRVIVDLRSNAGCAVQEIHCHGTVRGFDSNLVLAVEFDESDLLHDEYFVWFHDCMGMCPDSNGRWVDDRDVRHLPVMDELDSLLS